MSRDETLNNSDKVARRTRTLLTFTPGASPVNLTLAPVRDMKHSYVLHPDPTAGVGMVDVAHVRDLRSYCARLM